MHKTIRRAVTVLGATVGGLALLTGTASAHFCYYYAPDDAKLAKGNAWHTGEELTAWISGATSAWTGACATGRDALLEDVAQITADGGVFMGPGLLAGGTLRQASRTPDQFGHLNFGSIPEYCFAD